MHLIDVLFAAALLWIGGGREVVRHRWRAYRQRSRVVAGVTETPPVPQEQAPDVSLSLWLCDPNGHTVEHEIGWHQPDAPETYRYGGKVYLRHAAHPVRHKHDAIWEYRR